eukprot:jgi/Tetstr1/425638/TSEL_016058.t1
MRFAGRGGSTQQARGATALACAIGCLLLAALALTQLRLLPAVKRVGVSGPAPSQSAAAVQLRASALAHIHDLAAPGDDGRASNTASVPRKGQSVHYCECGEADSSAGANGTRPDLVCQPSTMRGTLREAQRSVGAVCKLKKQVIALRGGLSCQMQQAKHWLERRGRAYQQWYFTASRDEDTAQQESCDVTKFDRQSVGTDVEGHINRLKHKMMIAESLPAVASLAAVKHLLRAPGADMASLFYTRANMWQLRGDSQEPFTNATAQYMPPQLPLVEMPHCAVVGNSGVLLKHKPSMGKKIDRATVVVRVNQAPATKSYHEFVGSRTNIRVLNRKWTQMYATKYARMLHKEDAGNMIVATRAQTRYFERLGAEIAGANSTVRSAKMLLLANHNLVSYGMRLLRAFRNGLQEGTGIRFKGGDSPSSGFITILLMLQMCKKTTIYGFSMGAMHIMGTACLEPPPPGLGPCGRASGSGWRLGRAVQALWGRRVDQPGGHCQWVGRTPSSNGHDAAQEAEQRRPAAAGRRRTAGAQADGGSEVMSAAGEEGEEDAGYWAS